MSQEKALKLIRQAKRERWTELDLTEEVLYSLPPDLFQLTQLEKLSIANIELFALPKEFFQLTQLKILEVIGCHLTALPPEIGELSQLQKLVLIGNKLTTLPQEIGNLTRLTELHLDRNQLTALPPEIGQLTGLTTLGLLQNQLITLPSEIGNLTRLTELNLNSNNLVTLPPGLEKLKQLTGLFLGDSQLVTLPAGIGQLTQLTGLNLSNNRLTTLPPEIGKLTQLTILYINSCQLTSLPPEIGELTKLNILSLSDNQLTTLPLEIGKITGLKELHLEGNLLTTIPPELCQLTQLEELSINDNPELGLPPEILGPSLMKKDKDTPPASPHAILNYYFRLHPELLPCSSTKGKNVLLEVQSGMSESYAPTIKLVQPRRPLNEAKVIMVGEGDVGKTSIVLQLLKNEPAKPGRGKTKGIDIHRWNVKINDKDIRLNVWDFGGQEIMHATHQMFMTERSVYVLVLDSRRSEQANRLEEWLKIIDSFSNSAPVIVVCNQCDEEAMDLPRRDLRKKHPSIVNFVLCVCCLEGKEKGLDEVRDLIFQQVNTLEHVNDKLPSAWFDVKQELEKWRENKKVDFITLDHFRDICIKHGELEEKFQDQMLNLFHKLGTVLHFPQCDGQRLNVLNPDWVIKGIYDILNSDALSQAHARLDETLLGKILTGGEYPADKRKFIVEMMKQFELCWQFPDVSPWQMLVPDRLGKENQNIGDWDDALEFQFKFEVLPSSILNRFMVRKHEWIANEQFWRYGVVMRNPCKNEHNLVLVQTDQKEGILYISVKGNAGTRKQFLWAIRAELSTIIRDIRNLEYKQRVPLPGEDGVTVSYDFLCELEKDGDTGEQRFEGAKMRHSVSKLLNGVEEPQKRQRRDRMGEEYNIQADEVHIHGKKIDKRIHDIKADQFQASTGDHNTQKMNVTLPEPSETDMGINLAAIRTIIDELRMEMDDKEYVLQQVNNVEKELGDDKPNPETVGKAFERVTGRLEKFHKLAGAVTKMIPYSTAIANFVGGVCGS